jgi:hypothetical protein
MITNLLLYDKQPILTTASNLCSRYIVAVLFPIFESYKAIRSRRPADLSPCLMYWVVVSVSLYAESWILTLLGWYSLVILRDHIETYISSPIINFTVRNLESLPKEIWDNILVYLQSIPAQTAMETHGLHPLKSAKHHVLWGSIFKSEEWLQKMAEMRGTPFLFGPQLDQVGLSKERKEIYMTLHCGRETVDPDYHLDLFLKCLHPHHCDKSEIKFRSGITLNISEIENPEGPCQLGPERLMRLLSFEDNGQPVSQYSFYDNISTIQQSHIIGVGGPPYTSKALTHGYAINFPYGKGTTQVRFGNREEVFLVDYDCDNSDRVLKITLK